MANPSYAVTMQMEPSLYEALKAAAVENQRPISRLAMILIENGLAAKAFTPMQAKR